MRQIARSRSFGMPPSRTTDRAISSTHLTMPASHFLPKPARLESTCRGFRGEDEGEDRRGGTLRPGCRYGCGVAYETRDQDPGRVRPPLGWPPACRRHRLSSMHSDAYRIHQFNSCLDFARWPSIESHVDSRRRVPRGIAGSDRSRDVSDPTLRTRVLSRGPSGGRSRPGCACSFAPKFRPPSWQQTTGIRVKECDKLRRRIA